MAVYGTSPFTILIPREDVFAELNDSYLEVEAQIVKNADDTLYADNDAIQPNNLFVYKFIQRNIIIWFKN